MVMDGNDGTHDDAALFRREDNGGYMPFRTGERESLVIAVKGQRVGERNKGRGCVKTIRDAGVKMAARRASGRRAGGGMKKRDSGVKRAQRKG